jgi:hypothetical protein
VDRSKKRNRCAIKDFAIPANFQLNGRVTQALKCELKAPSIFCKLKARIRECSQSIWLGIVVICTLKDREGIQRR